MRTYVILVLLAGISLFTACHEETVKTFEDTREIYFDKFFVNAMYPGTQAADSTVTSFFFYPDTAEYITADLVVCLSGKPLTSDLHFGLKVVAEETTARPEEYKIDDYYTFHVDNEIKDSSAVKDVIRVKLRRSDRMDTLPNGVRLVVEIIPNEELKWGQIERIRAKIIVTTVEAKPDWWTLEVETNLLGRYSQKKYKLFLNHADTKGELNTELIKSNPDMAIKLVMKFKQWLNEQQSPVMDEDGSPMEVKI